MRYQGRISQWHDERGFGFVEPDGGGERAFVHIKAFAVRSGRPAEGDLISYELECDEGNRVRASSIRFVGAKAGPRWPPLRFLVALGFAVLLVGLAWCGKLSWLIPGVYGFVSLVTYIAYESDKSAARANRWRTRESTLHLLAMLGGWPGALVAQHTLRHKSRKLEFQMVFWTTAALNVGGLYWLLTGVGGRDPLLLVEEGVRVLQLLLASG